MRAERDRRARHPHRRGHEAVRDPRGRGRRQAEILRAEGDKQAAVLRAQGEAEAIQTVFNAIHVGDPDDKLLAYQYLQTLPKISESASNKLWIIPSEFTEALKGIDGNGVRCEAAVTSDASGQRRPEDLRAGRSPPLADAHRP